MKLNRQLLCLLLTAIAFSAAAQTDKEEKKEQQQERKAANQDKVDVNVFRRMILATKEYSDERRKIPALQKANKVKVRIEAIVDSLSDNEDAKKLTGYIRRDIGDNSVNVYEVIFDRSIKKIISVKPTGEGNEDDNEESADQKKAPPKHTAKTKKKTDDDDDEDEDPKPFKKKQKDEDD